MRAMLVARMGRSCGGGSGLPSRRARSERRHWKIALIARMPPATQARAASTSRMRSPWVKLASVVRATPPATNASAVRSHASAVRSFANENRASGSDPTEYTEAGRRPSARERSSSLVVISRSIMPPFTRPIEPAGALYARHGVVIRLGDARHRDVEIRHREHPPGEGLVTAVVQPEVEAGRQLLAGVLVSGVVVGVSELGGGGAAGGGRS